jgi:hypothetical protein
MKCSQLILLLTVFVIQLTAQAQNESFVGDLQHNNVHVYDANGKPFVNPNLDIAGTPFYVPEWKYGYIITTDNKVYSKRLLRLNLQTNEVHYLSESNTEMSLHAGSVKEIFINDSSKFPAMQYRFQSGLPTIDDQNEFSFYQVISKGKISLLKSFRKAIITEKNELSGEINKEFRTYEDYYIFTGASIIRIKKNNDFFLPLLKDKKAEIEQYIKKANLGTRNAGDIKMILDYYNSL